MKKVLITGISGGLGRLVAHKLLRREPPYRVCGVDRNPMRGLPPEVTTYQVDVRKKKIEDVIRTEKPQAIVHLAFVRHFAAHPALRHEINVSGTRRLVEFAVHHGVENVVVWSSAYVYGAMAENPYYMDETFPLSVSRIYPEVRDLTEVDMLATSYLWQYPEVATAILRPVNVLGPNAQTAINRYIRRDYVPTVMGFNPMFQFIHEEDAAEAIVLSIEKNIRGVFNLAGSGAVPLKVAIHETGGTAVPLPEALTRPIITSMFRWGVYPFPPGAIDFTKYPCTLDDTRFREATQFTPQYSLEETFASVRH